MGWLNFVGSAISGVIGFFNKKGELKNEKLKMIIAAAKGRVRPRVMMGWVCILAVLGMIGWDIVMNEGANLDALAALLIVAVSV